MAKIIDPDSLVRDTHVSYNTGTKRISLNSGGVLDAKDGVTLKAIYSFTKEEWKDDAALIPSEFPFTPITDEQFELVDGWDWTANDGRYLIRDGGWAVLSSTGNYTEKWTGAISLGTIEADDQPYYLQSGSTSVNFKTQGIINEPLRFYNDVDGDGVIEPGDGDYNYLSSQSVYTREQGQLYDKSTLADIGVSELTYQAYRYPLATADDLNIAASDATINSTSPYTQIKTRWFPQSFNRKVDSTTLFRNFGIVADVGTHSGVDASLASAGTVLETNEGGIDLTLYDSGTLTLHSGGSAGVYTIGDITVATQVPITGAGFPALQSGASFTLQRATPIVATKKQIYEKIQYLLRQNSDMDEVSGAAVVGKVADELLEFVGADLKAGTKTPVNPKGGGSGVLIEGFDTNDTNNLFFFDNAGTSRNYPFVAAGSIAFNTNLQNDASAKFWMFYEYTERFTNTGFSITGASGSAATLNSSVTDLVAELANGDYIRIAGFAGAANNGVWQLTGAPSGSGPWTATVTKVDGATVANESAGPSVSLDKKPVGTPDAIIADDNDDADITGTIGGAVSVAFDYDYDNNVQGGRTAATNAAVVIRAIGLATAQFVEVTGIITRATGLSFSLVSPLERNYSNP